MPPIASKSGLTPSQAAEIIGCTVQHIRLLVRTEKLKAMQETFGDEIRYRIPRSEVIRYQKLKFDRGQRRGVKLTRKAKSCSSSKPT